MKHEQQLSNSICSNHLPLALEYNITIKTGELQDAGTDGAVKVRFYRVDVAGILDLLLTLQPIAPSDPIFTEWE